MAELPENATIGNKLQALYDWVIDICHYDYVSYSDGKSSDKRKKQDAYHVVKYGMGVCEGYANLYTALARLAGVKSAWQCSDNLNHAWVECYYNGQWKMVDATWDDPSEENVTESIPNSGNYDYFLIDPNDVSHMKDGVSDKETDYSRTVGIK
jgi:transglutaminase/protease-like cytokinesis protein 3